MWLLDLLILTCYPVEGIKMKKINIMILTPLLLITFCSFAMEKKLLYEKYNGFQYLELVKNEDHQNAKGNKRPLLKLLLGDPVVVGCLIDNGANVNETDKNGVTPLIEACYLGYSRTVKLLLENGADVNFKDNNGRTALMVASYQGHRELVRSLIEKSADVNQKDNNGRTALMYSSIAGKSQIAELLFYSGVIIDVKDSSGLTAISYAVQCYHQEMADMLNLFRQISG